MCKVEHVQEVLQLSGITGRPELELLILTSSTQSLVYHPSQPYKHPSCSLYHHIIDPIPRAPTIHSTVTSPPKVDNPSRLDCQDITQTVFKLTTSLVNRPCYVLLSGLRHRHLVIQHPPCLWPNRTLPITQRFNSVKDHH